MPAVLVPVTSPINPPTLVLVAITLPEAVRPVAELDVTLALLVVKSLLR